MLRDRDRLFEVSRNNQIALSWHPGFTLPASEVPEVFRGLPVRPLAERVAEGGILDGAKIGAMANTVELEPKAWEGWGECNPSVLHESILAQFRRLWHVLVSTGRPREGRGRRRENGGRAAV